MTSKATWTFASLIVGGALTGMTASSLAQSPAQALLDDSFVASLGTFVVNSNLKANLNGGSATNPEVNFDDTFGKSRDATRWRFDGLWRITPAHHLRLMYFDNANSRTKTLANDLEWGDYTFNKGTSATLDFRQQTTALSYEYAFMRTPTYEVAASLGVHYSKTKLGLSGQATVTHPDGSTTNDSGAVSSNSVAAPLPLIGLRGGWVVAPQWYVDAGASVFKMKYDNYDGQWTDWRAAATWMYNRNFGVGLGVNGFTANVKITKDNFDGRLKSGYSGLQVFATGAF